MKRKCSVCGDMTETVRYKGLRTGKCRRCLDLCIICLGQEYREISPSLCVGCEWFAITCKDKKSWSGEHLGKPNMCGFYVPALVVDKNLRDRAACLNKDGSLKEGYSL